MRVVETVSTGGPSEPPITFWEHALEIPASRLLAFAEEPGFIGAWLKRRSLRQVSMLRAVLGLPIDAPAQERRTALHECSNALRRFVLAAEFAARKSMHATLAVAKRCLSATDIALACEAEGRYDTTALVFAILDRAWPELETVFHLDKLHKVGFARMRLVNPPRRPERRLSEFLNSGELLSVLRHYDARQDDHHRTELQKIIELSGSQVVFLRRPHQQSLVLSDDRVVHGFTADQIVLDFRDEAARLNVASHGHAASYDIANAIASAYYGEACTFENITEATYPAQISRFLRSVRDQEAHDLRLIELLVHHSPLSGGPDLLLKNGDDLSIGPALGQLEQVLNWTIDDLDRIPRFKILFAGKRVAMELEPIEDGAEAGRMFVLRYRDQTLSLEERAAFEERMEHEHGIKVVSTEKRGARGRKR